MSIALSADRLTEIRARLAAATPGPWMVANGCHDPSLWVRPAAPRSKRLGAVACVLPANNNANADLIAHAPADLAFLLAEVGRLQADAARLDWMEKQQRVRVGYLGADALVSWYAVDGPLRAAIDAEMQSEGREP